MDNEKSEVTYIKATYIWSFENKYETLIKVIKSINNNIKIQNVTILRDKEYLLKPRSIVNDPFSDDNSILLLCDIIDLENKCHSNDGRITFLKVIHDFNSIITKLKTKISFCQKFKLSNIDIMTEDLINKFISLCLKCNIDLDEISIKDDVLEVSNNFTNLLSCCDELSFLRFLFFKFSKINNIDYIFHENLIYKFIDVNTLGEDGYFKTLEYVDKLRSKHELINKDELCEKFVDNEKFTIGENLDKMIVIPKSVQDNNKNAFFIDQRFNANSDPYTIIYTNIIEIYDN